MALKLVPYMFIIIRSQRHEDKKILLGCQKSEQTRKAAPISQKCIKIHAHLPSWGHILPMKMYALIAQGMTKQVASENQRQCGK